ncbi:MAG: hypothetical protein K6G38_03455 [Gammaproteobacteria bacterium]|nr:hypothetical protein [Gammaproteobacteria bacterium]
MIFGKKNRNSVIIHYNTANDIFIKLYYFTDSKLQATYTLPLTRQDLSGLCPRADDKIINFIKDNIPDYSHMYVVISNKMTFKTTTIISNSEKKNKNLLYLEDIKGLVPNYKDKFNLITSTYKGSQDTFYYTYYIPLEVTAYFTRIAESLKANLEGIDNYTHYIFNLARSIIGNKNFILHYYNEAFSTLIISYQGTFTSYQICNNTPADIMESYCIYYTKHIIELEKTAIDDFYSNKSELVNFAEGVKPINIEFTDQLFDGINLQ